MTLDPVAVRSRARPVVSAARRERRGRGRRSRCCTGSPRPAGTSSTARGRSPRAAFGRSPTTPAGTASPIRPPPGTGYGYPELATDSRRVLDRLSDRPAARVLAGPLDGRPHAGRARRSPTPSGWRGSSSIGPPCASAPRSTDESLAYWDALADGLERGGVDGFIEAYDHDLDPAWRDTMLRITRDRLGRHRHPEAVAEALREVPRSQPVRGPRRARVPRRAGARRRQPRRGGPRPPVRRRRGLGRAPAEATLISEEPGASPLAWQGGRLSREIAAFCERTRGRRAPRRLSETRPPRRSRSAVDEAQAGPGLVDRADLVVDQPGREAELADHVLGQVGGDARGALRPRDPEPAGRDRRSARARPRRPLELRPRGSKKATTTSSGAPHGASP